MHCEQDASIRPQQAVTQQSQLAIKDFSNTIQLQQHTIFGTKKN